MYRWWRVNSFKPGNTRENETTFPVSSCSYKLWVKFTFLLSVYVTLNVGQLENVPVGTIPPFEIEEEEPFYYQPEEDEVDYRPEGEDFPVYAVEGFDGSEGFDFNSPINADETSSGEINVAELPNIGVLPFSEFEETDSEDYEPDVTTSTEREASTIENTTTEPTTTDFTTKTEATTTRLATSSPLTTSETTTSTIRHTRKSGIQLIRLSPDEFDEVSELDYRNGVLARF